jgi:hypothetical protein
MIQVSFRFYAQLNDFLPWVLRRQRFTRVLPPHSSVKDTIEALGPPHPEVELVVVNGEPVGFERHLQDGDHVAVYPRFRSIDVTGVRRVGGDPPDPVRFSVDVHLGKLASLLRLAGFDAVTLADDAAVAHTAEREARVVLTRDVGLLKRSAVRHGYWVRHITPELQLAEVLERFGLLGRMEPFARCLRCNSRLLPVEADAVADRLLPRTRSEFREFRVCPGCERIYWQGSHYARLAEVLDVVRRRLGG